MYLETLQKLISPKFDKNTLQEILQNSSGLKEVIVKNVELYDTAHTKGYSFLSSVIKFKVEGTAVESDGNEKVISCAVIVKTLPKNIGRRKSFRSTDFFRNEVSFYKVWNELMKFQDSKNIKNKFDNLPRCLAMLADGNNDFIALEDLSAQSYSHFDKQNPLDYESIIFTIRLFARFHALSFAYKDQFPENYEKLTETIEETYFDEKYRNWYRDFQKSLIHVSRDAIKKELPEIYLQKFDEIVNNDLFGLLVKICKDKQNKLSVITQGDSWIPNFLVKYSDNNKLHDIKLIDFQLARCCSPACDLNFFLYCCADYELLNKHWLDFVKEYHSAFIAFLSELGSNPGLFKFEDFLDDVKKNVLIGFGMVMEALPFQLMDESEAPDLDSIEGDEEIPITTVFKVFPLKTAEKRRKLTNLFKHMIENNFI